MPDQLEPAASPCLKQCELDDAKQVCVSCWRLLDEIARWGTMAPEDQHKILAALPKRKAAFLARKQESTLCAGQ